MEKFSLEELNHPETSSTMAIAVIAAAKAGSRPVETLRFKCALQIPLLSLLIGHLEKYRGLGQLHLPFFQVCHLSMVFVSVLIRSPLLASAMTKICSRQRAAANTSRIDA